MAITVTTAAASYNLASLHGVRRERGLVSLSGLTITVTASDRTIVRASGDWSFDGVVDGQWVELSGAAQSANNDRFRVQSVAGKTLTVFDPDTVLVDETATANVKLWDPIQDADFTEWLKRASDIIVTDTGRRFAREIITETLVGARWQSNKLRLSLRPVVTLTTVTFDGTAVTDVELEEPDQGMIRLGSGFTWSPDNTYLRIDPVPLPTSGKRLLWSFSYTGGFITPDLEVLPGTPRNLPHLVEVAALEIVNLMADGRFAPSVTAERIGDWSASYGIGAAGPLAAILETLRPFREIEVA